MLLGALFSLMKRRHSEYGRLWRSQNPLDDESFAQGKPWLGVAPSKVKISPQKEEPPPPRPLPPPPNPQVGENEKPKSQEGWFGGWCSPSTIITDNSETL